MSTPSLLNIPYLYKAGTLYSQIPESGAGDFTVTRATTPTAGRSTRVNKDGLIELVADNVPRLDYPLGGAVNGCPALLVEPSATNSFIESQTLFTTHLVQNLTTSGYTNAATSPDGSVTAEKFVPNATSGVHGIANGSSLAITSGTTYTFSLFVKSDGGPYNLISLTFDSTTAWGATRNCIFNASNGANFAVPSGATMTSENYGNGWYRIRATLTAVGNVAASTFQYRIYVADASGNLSWAAPSGNTNGIFVWGAQLEVGSVPTSYIPTTTQAIARGADVVRKTGITSLIGQSEGTVYFEVEVTAEARNRWIFSLDSAANSFIQCYITTAGVLGVSISNAGATVMTSLNSSVLSVGYHKVAFAYNTATNGCVMFIDGVQNPVASRTVTGAGLPAFNNFTFGSYFSTQTDTLKGHVRQGELYPNRLTNAQLAALTAP